MAGVTFNSQEFTSPYFLGEVLGNHNVMPFPAKVVASAFTADSNGVKYIPAGTLVGRTYTERDAGTGFGVPDVVTPDDEIYLTAFPVDDAVKNTDVELIRHGTVIKENYLPGWSDLSAGVKAAIRERYQCITGVN